MRKIAINFFKFLGIYIILSGVIFNHIVPSRLSLSDEEFNKKYSVIKSRSEGLTIDSMYSKDRWLYGNITFDPLAEGPPMHVHQNFDERFEVCSGVLSIYINGEKKVLYPGDVIIVPKGTPHKPFNESKEIVTLSSKMAIMPTQFAIGLSKLYPVMDKYGTESLPTFLKISKLGLGFDTWLHDKPIIAQKAIRWLLNPTLNIISYFKSNP